MTFRGFLHHLNRRDTRLLPKFTKTSKVLIFLFLLASAPFAIKSFAQVDLFKQKQDAIRAGTNLETWNDEAIGNNAFSMFRGLVGELPSQVLSQDYSNNSSPTAWIPGGLFGSTNNMIAKLNSPPASGLEYIANTWNSFLGKPAYAQGIGFQGLAPLLPLWRGFRNITYVLFSLVFIVIGLMIMLRVKISPQAVVTIQNAIPKLVTSLIMVTFSYAIAGLIIDLSYLIQGVFVALFFSISGKPLNSLLFKSRFDTGFFGLAFLGNVARWLYDQFFATMDKNPLLYSFSDLSSPTFRTFLQLTYRAAPGWWSSTLLGGLLGSVVLGTFNSGVASGFLGGLGADLGNITGSVAGGAIGGILGGVLFPLIICIMSSIWLIKLYFGMLKAYVTIILKIVIAPLEIAIGAFPASKMGFSSWATDLIANIAIFPIISLFLILINLIIDAFMSCNSGISCTIWSPGPLVFGGEANSGILAGCIGLAGLALLSKLPEMIPQVIFQLKNPFGQAIGENLQTPKLVKQVGTATLGAGMSKIGTSNLFTDRREETDPATGAITRPARPAVAGRFAGGAKSFWDNLTESVKRGH